jgi:bla regulator protein BlaR1
MTSFLHGTSGLVNHLWQSALFAAVAWLLTLALRKNQARARYWIWLAASLKFLVPFSLLFVAGSYLRPAAAPPIARADVSTAMTQAAQPFSVEAPIGLFVASAADTRNSQDFALIVLAAIWVCGFMGVAFCWWRRWLRVRAAVRRSAPIEAMRGNQITHQVMESDSLFEPGVFGIFRPVLMLPAGIMERLTMEQTDAILAHEMCHVRRRDNLTAAIHMFVEAAFWFHPMVWWIGTRMVEERERACDEEVLLRGNEAETYAEGILNVCKFYMESPVACVSGVSGSDLKKRIVRIMTQRRGDKLSLARKWLLGVAAAGAIAVPLVFGVMNAPLLRAQAAQEAQPDPSGPLPSFEVASIKLAPPGGRGHGFQMPDPGRFRTINASPKLMIQFAYNLKDFQLMGGPNWTDSKEYDIDAKVSDEEVAAMAKMPGDQGREQLRLMMRSLLADRFKLTVSHEAKELPIYALVVAKGGPKLTPTTYTPPDPGAPKPPTEPKDGPHLLLGNGTISGAYQPISRLADLLASVPDLGGRVVQDQTGITGRYDFEMRFSMQPFPGKNGGPLPDSAPAADDTSEPSIFTALEEQMGLKLESTKGPVEVYTIQHIEEPSEN